MKVIRLPIRLVCFLAALIARADEKRAELAPVDGVPSIYWALFRGGIPEDEVEGFRAKLPYESVTLERTPCYGPCPVYTVTLHRSGEAELHGERNLPLSGDFVGELDALSFGRLCYALDHFHFNEFKDSYAPPMRWTDDTTCIVTVRTDNKGEKRVSDYGSVGPIELWTIQQLIDGFRERIKWKAK